MNKLGPPESIDLPDWGPPSACAMLRQYCLSTGCLNPYSSSLISSVFKLFPNYPSKPLFVKELQRVVLASRIPNAKEYSGHSMRSGGASDLWAMNVPLEAIKKQGRWKSDCILLYFRDHPVKLPKPLS